MRLAPVLLFVLTACASSSGLLVPAAWTSTPRAAAIPSVTLDSEGKVTVGNASPPPAGPVRVAEGRLWNGGTPLTDPFAAIESFDVSGSRGEVAFAAKREQGFDVGLVSTDVSPISWVPSDPADEVMVQWAPRGNKISYVIRLGGGDVVRTVHVPTAFERTVAFPLARIHALAWDPEAERYAVAFSTASSSDQVEVVRFGGEDRRVAIAPAETLPVEVEPLGSGAILLRPRDLAYGEKLPVVVWEARDFGWNDARAALMRRARLACVVTDRPPGPALWELLSGLKWADPDRRFVVSAVPPPATPDLPRGAILIAPEPAIPPGRYVRSGAVVAVSPAVVQSFAAGFVPAHLERTTPTNGSSR